jgi:geranylgeranyl pyrophosphate synthase
MWQDKLAKLLVDEIEAVLSSLDSEADFHRLVRESVNLTKRGLTTRTKNNRVWALLPLLVCEAISRQYEQSIPAAAAIQLLVSAGDIFDDIEDADSSESLSTRFGSAIAINVATTLLILSEKAMMKLERKGVADKAIIRVVDVFNSYFTSTCIGQHLDLSLNPTTLESEDMYLKVADMKTASTVQCACHIGALLATSNQEIIDIFAMFGKKLGMTFQIANDIQGITRGNDIQRRKITLPVIYALSQADKDIHDQLISTFSKKFNVSPDVEKIKDILFRTGAIQYAMIKMESYKQQALDALSMAATKGISVERLKMFVE